MHTFADIGAALISFLNKTFRNFFWRINMLRLTTCCNVFHHTHSVIVYCFLKFSKHKLSVDCRKHSAWPTEQIDLHQPLSLNSWRLIFLLQEEYKVLCWVCLFACLFVRSHISKTTQPKFWCMLPVAVAQSSSGGVAIRYVHVLLVLWMTSYFHMIALWRVCVTHLIS